MSGAAAARENSSTRTRASLCCPAARDSARSGALRRGPVARLSHPARELRDGLHDLRATPFVAGRSELSLQLGACEPQRLERPRAFRIAHDPDVLLRALVFEILAALLNPRLGVNQSLARITHSLTL